MNHTNAPGKTLIFVAGIFFLVIAGLAAIGIFALLADGNVAQAISSLLFELSYWTTIGILGLVHCGDLKWARRLRNWGIFGIVWHTLGFLLVSLVSGPNPIQLILSAVPILLVVGAQRNISARNNISKLVQSGFSALELSEWAQADHFFEQALFANPENANAYIGKLCVELRLSREEDLLCYGPALAGYGNYQKAVQFADETYQTTLEPYVLTSAERLERETRRFSELADKVEKARAGKSYTECRALMSALKALPDLEETARARLELGTVTIDPKEVRRSFYCPICGTSQERERKTCTMCGIEFAVSE